MITFEEIRSKLKPLRWIDSPNSDGDPTKWTLALNSMSIEAHYSDFLNAWIVENNTLSGITHIITTKANNLEEVDSMTMDWIAERIVNGLEQ